MVFGESKQELERGSFIFSTPTIGVLNYHAFKVFNQFFFNRKKKLAHSSTNSNPPENEFALQFKTNSTASGFNLFKRSFNTDNSIVTLTDIEGNLLDDESDTDGEKTSTTRHDAIVDFNKKVTASWAELSEDRKAFWNAQAAEINKLNNIHNPEDCFQYVLYRIIS